MISARCSGLGEREVKKLRVLVQIDARGERDAPESIDAVREAGVTDDLPRVGMYQGARTLRLADGPDEVHKIVIAKNVMKQHHASGS